MEHLNYNRRNTSQERLEGELVVAINGPPIEHSESVVLDSLTDYFKNYKARINRESGHFVRRYSMKTYATSKAVDN